MSTTQMHPVDDEITKEVRANLDRAIADLTVGADSWSRLGLDQRATLITETQASIARHANDWVAAAIAAKGTHEGSMEGEEWISGPYASLAGFGRVAHSLTLMAKGESPLSGVKAQSAPGGRIRFKVLPSSLLEYTLFHGFTGEVWLKPGVPEDQARGEAGLGALRVGENGGVGLVLGAGNIASIGPLDVLYELVAFNRASVLKLNPTFAGLTEAYSAAFKPLIDANLLRIVNGAAKVGGYLTRHPGIAHVHITGSAATHDAIVWGTGATASANREAGTPVLDKPISSELGGVSPTIIIPGKWSKADLKFQAEQIATQRLQNSGHNCIATQTLILSAEWKQKDEFLAELRRVFDRLPRREPWYPGSDRKMDAARSSYPQAEDHSGRLLIEVSEATSRDLFATEYFSPVLGHTALPGTGAEFFRAAVEFANTELDGTLGASIAVAPKDKRAIKEFDEILAGLRYGSIGVNAWSAVAFLGAPFTWGAFPGNTLEQVGSGIGVVHNAHLIDNTERSVIYGPFRTFPRSVLHGENSLFPRPPWFVTARTAHRSGAKLSAFAAKPSWLKLPGIFADAFRG
ncbi:MULTISPECIES: aldehyde dehydrogenase family protein [unclassified Streptomyces]|uniref:aldehyde dehydrogenase family protein n=1 Tax=unclassified Streptomyces TaxID=2593676 RepID=UPI0022531D5B|nr:MULTISPECIES: aldehyde dehydrogenase family protein [unclassified Streptomyces]MCX4409894.1 aldehyde dehydrogenase family protein [Streptomyces sp. NBC_01764]MCX5191666.1 aldehyde dehydrogenase family protein [Streptomyces sp. NBC_00268]